MFDFLFNHKEEIEILFKLVMVLASLGVIAALGKKIYTVIRKYLFFFSDQNARIEALEKRVFKKRKTKTKTNEQKKD